MANMTDKEKRERKELRVEIKARKLIIKKLDTAIAALEMTASRQRSEREAKREKLLTYKTYGEAQDAYGWGIITEEEFDEITTFLESSQEMVDAATAEDIAFRTLKGWRSQVAGEQAALKFELLPQSEQSRIREENLRILKEREQRRKERENGRPDQPI